jgi:hypothetical protein
MSFFHNLNKTLDSIAAKPEAAQLNERDMSRAAKGYEKYGKEGMQALAKAGREGKALDPVRNKYDKYDNKEVDEGLGDVVKKVGGMAKKAGNAVLNKLGHGSDADMIRDLQKRMGIPQTGMKPTEEPKEGNEFSGELQKARATGQKEFEVDGKEYPVKETEMSPKQKSFAALAEPKNKITFADKIAGAKKEVDEMLGDVAAEAMKQALRGGKQVVASEEEDLNPFTNYKKPRATTPRTGEVTHGAKHDTEWTATGRKVTRRVDPQGMSVGSDTDAEGNTPEKRGRGRPKGPAKGPERTTANAYKHKGERKVKEEDDNVSDEIKQAMAMLKKAGYKVSKAVEEESTDTRDNHAEKAGKKVAKDIEYDEKKKDGIHGKKRGAEDDKAEKAGKKVTKDIEHDDKKDEVKEDEPKKSKSKFKFGGSVYEALDAQLETLITEGMSVTVNMSQDSEHGEDRKNITVNADGEDADRLAELLQMAGMSQQSSSCSSCGSSPCGCDMIDENNPNWPTDSETNDNAMQYSGGLNGPKSTGQATTPVLASQLRRQVSMEESARVEQNLLNLYRTFGK